MNDEDKRQLQQIIDTGSNVVGTATGNLLGFLLADAPGAALGGAIGASLTGVIKQVTLDIIKRSLSHREEMRIGVATTCITDRVQQRLAAGELPRNDGFFEEKLDGSLSNAEEIFEGVLLKSKNQHQEKKIKFISAIFSNTTFTAEISLGEANHILQVAENITYRQMCLISLFERKAELEKINLSTKYLSDQDNNDEMPVLDNLSTLQEIYQLNNLGLVACENKEQTDTDGFIAASITNSKNYQALLSYDDVIPDYMILTDYGKRFYSIMNLLDIPNEDLIDVAETISE